MKMLLEDNHPKSLATYHNAIRKLDKFADIFRASRAFVIATQDGRFVPAVRLAQDDMSSAHCLASNGIYVTN